jgi:glycosyltransferase involved in cell wall biosynthesis
MRISLLVSDFSKNCLGRAYILAKMLEPKYEVEIVGPLFGEKIWQPCDTKEFVYKPIPCIPVFPDFLKRIRRIEDLILGDIIYASKPWFTSFGIGILTKLKRRRPLLLDIDDWELGWYLPYRFRKMASLSVRTFLNTNGFLSTFLLEKMICLADGVTTASKFLQKRFGGVYIPHARDTNFLDPSKYDGDELRKKLGLKDGKIIMFLGSPKPHKGIEDLFCSLEYVQRKDVKLLIIGASNGYLSKSHVSEGMKPYVIVKGMIPFMRIPDYLACSDLIVIPQKNIVSNHAQVPAKLFDAMAMGKPIISTRISDMPEILRDCGFVVEPGDPKDLAQKIHYVLENPLVAKKIGEKARMRCIRKYSLEVVGERLINYIQKVVT